MSSMTGCYLSPSLASAPPLNALSSDTWNARQFLTLSGAFQGSMLCIFYSSCWNFFSPFLSYTFPRCLLSSLSWGLSGELILIL